MSIKFSDGCDLKAYGLSYEIKKTENKIRKAFCKEELHDFMFKVIFMNQKMILV